MSGLKLTIKWKFILSFVAAIVVVSALQSIVYFRSETHNLQKSLERKLLILANMIADNSTSSLSFRSSEDADEVLSSLDNEPMIQSAFLYLEDGELFVAYPKETDPETIPVIKEFVENIRVDNNRVTIQKPIVLDDEVIGLIHLSGNLTELDTRRDELYGFFAVVIVFVIAFSIFIAYMGERIFIKPIVALSNLSQRIGQQQSYELRAKKISEDEVGQLVDNFNKMLDAIERHEKSLLRKTNELMASNKELEQFAYVTTHDLKTPLVTISGYAGRLSEHMAAKDFDKMENAVNRIQASVSRMGQLIEDVLAFSRIGRTQERKAAIDLNRALAEIIEDLQESIAAKQTKVIVETLPTITANENEIRQIFQNLIENALSHGCPEPQSTISIGCKETKIAYNIYVRDEGAGIAPRYHAKIFELFYRLDTNRSGSGLGLAIVDKIMSLLHGRVWLESDEGVGATFWLCFPK